MTASSTIRALVAFLILVVLNYTVRPLLGWRAEIDFLIIALLLAAVRVRPGTAAIFGCALGLVADSMTPGSFGAGALAMSIVGFAASWLKAVFFADNLALNGFFFFAGRWAYAVIYLLAQRQRHGVEMLQEMFVWAPLSGAVTAAAGVILLVLMRPFLEPASA